mgnify:CR=1 FL=1
MPLSPENATEEEWSAARRLRDAVDLHLQAQGDGAHGKYIAVRLEDGSHDGNLYDTRADAVRHQINDPWCFYVRLSVGGMQLMEAWTVLLYARQAKTRGIVFAEEEVILPQRLELAGGDTAARVLPEMFRGRSYVG